VIRGPLLSADRHLQLVEDAGCQVQGGIVSMVHCPVIAASLNSAP
jgi:hypothetical protein